MEVWKLKRDAPTSTATLNTQTHQSRCTSPRTQWPWSSPTTSPRTWPPPGRSTPPSSLAPPLTQSSAPRRSCTWSRPAAGSHRSQRQLICQHKLSHREQRQLICQHKLFTITWQLICQHKLFTITCHGINSQQHIEAVAALDDYILSITHLFNMYPFKKDFLKRFFYITCIFINCSSSFKI